MDIVQLLIDAIAGEHGEVVAEQFTSSYENSNFIDKDKESLELIFKYLEKVNKAKLLHPTKSIEIQEYIIDLSDYLYL